jgi:hypothetical protein
MSAVITAHDRARAWSGLHRRALAQRAVFTREPVVDEVIAATAATERFDPLLIEDRVADWNAYASELIDVVTGKLAARRPGNDALVRTYVWMHVYDWLMLPSEGALQAFVEASLAARRRWGLRRDLFEQKLGAETFHGTNTPRVVLRDVGSISGTTTIVDFVDFWPHKKGFTIVSAITDSEGEIIVLDVEARAGNLVSAALLAEIAGLCRSWRGLLGEYRSLKGSLDMQLSHQGIESFPVATPQS